MTAELIARARELAGKATPGPWTNDIPPKSNGFYHVNSDTLGLGSIATCYIEEVAEANSSFIAASRALVPELADALEQAEAREAENRIEIDRLRNFAKGLGMVSEAGDIVEVSLLVCGLHDKIERLETALEAFLEYVDFSAAPDDDPQEAGETLNYLYVEAEKRARAALAEDAQP